MKLLRKLPKRGWISKLGRASNSLSLMTLWSKPMKKSSNAWDNSPHLTYAIRQAKIKKAHYLGADVEKTLTNLGEVFYGPQDIYTKMRAGDFEMADFEVDGKVIQE